MVTIVVTHEIRAAVRLATGRALLRFGALTGNPVVRLLGTRRHPDPFPALDRLRGVGPVVRTPIGLYATASYHQCHAVLRDPRFRVIEESEFVGVDWTRGPEDRRYPHPIDDSLLSMDAPLHTALRKVVAPSFTPRALHERKPGIERVVTDFLDAAERRGSFDVVRDFAVRVPVRVICELLGVPEDRAGDFMRWGTTLAESIDGVRTMGERRRVRDAVVHLDGFLEELVAERRRHPGDDVISLLVDDGELDHRHVLATAGLLLGAGYETTVGLIGNGVLALLDHPEHIPALADKPGFAADVVEEVLRYDPPVGFTARVPREDVTLSGITVPAGKKLMLMLAGANHDPAVFEHPHRFDPYRPNNREHLAFAAGSHFCLGAGLARIEGEIALRELFRRFPDLRRTGPVVPGRSRNLRGPASIPAALH